MHEQTKTYLTFAIESLERTANLTEHEITIPGRLAAIDRIHVLRAMLRDLE